jgi:REP-associated tyrosine transposase
MAPSKFIQTVKTNSSRWINEKEFLPNKFSWQVGGGIFSVSHRNVPTVVNYIKNQKKHHKKAKFRDEYLQLLESSGISFESDYLLEFFKE